MKAVKEIQQIYEEYQNECSDLWGGKSTDLDAVIRVCRTSARKIENVYLYSRRSTNTEFARKIGQYLKREIKDEQFRVERLKRKVENGTHPWSKK